MSSPYNEDWIAGLVITVFVAGAIMGYWLATDMRSLGN